MTSKTVTKAIGRNFCRELELPRQCGTGEFPELKTVSVPDNERERKKDYDYMVKAYGRDCHVFQIDPSGKCIRENKFAAVKARQFNNEAMGF